MDDPSGNTISTAQLGHEPNGLHYTNIRRQLQLLYITLTVYYV